MQAETRKKFIYMGIAFALFLIVQLLLPAGNGLTEGGVSTLAIFIGTIWLWIFVGVDWPSLLAPAALIIAGVLDQTTMMAVSFGNFNFAFVMATMLINTCLIKLGVVEYIAAWFTTRKFVAGHPWRFIIMFCLSCYVVALFMDCTPVTLVYLTLADSVCAELGYKKGSKFGKCLVAAILWLVVIAYAATPISHAIAVMIISSIEAATGYTVSFIDYMKVGMPFGALFFVITMVFFRLFVKPETENFKNYDPEERRKSMKPLSIEAKISIVVFLLVVLCWMMPDIFRGITPGLSAWFSSIGTVAPVIVGCVVLAIIHIKDKPILDVKKDIYSISIPTLIFVVGIQSFANSINNDATGVATWLGNIFTPMISTLSPFLIVAVTLALAIILTQFLSNLVVQTLFFTAFAPVLIAYNASGAGHVSVVAWGILLSIGVNISFLFPSAYICAPLCYTSGYLEVKDGVKWGLPVAIVGYIFLLCLWPLANSIFTI